MTKATVEDVARHAGLSSATVGRVLNGRGNVSSQAREKVAAAVSALSYRQLPSSISVSTKPILNFLFLIPERKTEFLKMFETAIDLAPVAVDDCNVKITICPIPFDADEAVIRELDGISEDLTQGVALFAIDAPGVRQAVERAKRRGIQVVTLVSDIPGVTSSFIGIDNVSAGRVAGNLMGRFICGSFSDLPAGPVGIICGTARLRDQIDRMYGFSQIMSRRFSNIELLAPLEGNSIPEVNYEFTKELLKTHPNLSGIYSGSAGNSGILEALSETDQSPITLMHELTPMVRDALSKGEVDAVLSQNVDHIARSAVRTLRANYLGRPILESQEKIEIDIFLTDNIP
jgi:LacI family transcriptional regulator